MKAGSIDTAPPSSTENMSSAIAPSMIWLENTKRAPSAMLRSTGARSAAGVTGSSTRSTSSESPASMPNAAATA